MRTYISINYNKRNKKQVKVIHYTIKKDQFGKTYIHNKGVYEYNNLYHFLVNDKGKIQSCELNGICEIVENKTQDEIIAMYNNLFHHYQ